MNMPYPVAEKSETKGRMTISLSDDVKEQLRRQAELLNLSVSDYITSLVPGDQLFHVVRCAMSEGYGGAGKGFGEMLESMFAEASLTSPSIMQLVERSLKAISDDPQEALSILRPKTDWSKDELFQFLQSTNPQVRLKAAAMIAGKVALGFKQQGADELDVEQGAGADVDKILGACVAQTPGYEKQLALLERMCIECHGEEEAQVDAARASEPRPVRLSELQKERRT